MAIQRSVLIAMAIAVTAAAWLLSGQLESGIVASDPDSDTQPEEALPIAVRVGVFEAQPHHAQIVMTGRTEAARRVELRTETAGPIAEVPVAEGMRVKRGDPIARIAPRDRQARLDEAKALVTQRKVEFEASEQLTARGHRASTQHAGARAALDAALARQRSIEVEIADATIRAPFDAVLESRAVEIGTFVDKGDIVATLVDLDPIRIVGAVSERRIAGLDVGMPGAARLVSGAVVEGRIRFVARAADPATRTFRVELEVPNPDGRISDGLTAEIVLPGPVRPAHLISPALLTLSDDGQVGVRSVDGDDVARFLPVVILEDTPQGIWITGLPDRVTLVVVGQEFVIDGQRVRPVPMGAEAGS